ncbi:MAG: hypothetical protein WC998_00545 [Candidatus Paceibacterota bacterium]|jgi:hypothetical protein
MSLDVGKKYTIGSGLVQIHDLYVGQVSDAYVEGMVAKAEHMTNTGIEFTRDAIQPISTSFNIGFAFQEISPRNVNYLLGMPGFRSIPADRKLSNNPIDPFVFGNYGMLTTEYAACGTTPEGMPAWTPLAYEMFHADTAAPLPPKTIHATNQTTPAAITGYWGFCSTIAKAGVVHPSAPSNMVIVPIYTVLPGTDVYVVRIYLDPTHVIGDVVQTYRFVYTYNPTYRCYIGTLPAADALCKITGGILTSQALINADILAGYVDISYDTALALSPGLPTIPLSVRTFGGGVTVVAAWLTDFEYDSEYRGHSQIKRVPTSIVIYENEVVEVQYYYNAGDAVEAPLAVIDGRNPIVPMKIIHPFPDNKSQMILWIPRVQIRSNFRIALNERDWMNLPFVGQAVDASDLYPNYPFGSVTFSGPIAHSICDTGNVPYGTGLAGYTPLLDDQTTWA